MKGLELINYEGNSNSFRVVEKETPEPKEGEVLIKLHLGTINPSDLAFIKGQYGIKKKLPIIGGFEGGGTIVKVGTNVQLKVGDRVACVADSGDGTWSDFLITKEINCLPLLDSTTLDEGSMLFVNPLTAYAMVNLGVEFKTGALVQTASASALGKMIIRYCKKIGLPTINIVRRKEQVELLEKEGAEHILNSSDSGFEKSLFKMTKKLDARFVLDAVSGEVATKILQITPNGTKFISYGALDAKPIELNPGMLIFQKKHIEGFWLTYWMQNYSREEIIKHSNELQKSMEAFRTTIHKRFPIENGYSVLEYYESHMSEGKTVFQSTE
ncbi:MAG: zinc-binding dehydrogenase [Leptospiraceae bacterium]|nr:zinc-binding dehydrogenase [Leptospiraceae bacterium]